MDRAQESQSLGEFILSVPNCIYWPCLAPPNPGLWWCINSWDWLFTRHLLAGVNIMRQIPPITLITPLPRLCLCQSRARWRIGRSCPEAASHFSTLAIVILQSDYLLSNCQPGSEVVTSNSKWIESNESREVKDNGRRIVGSNARLSASNHKNNFPHIMLLIEARSLNYSVTIVYCEPISVQLSLSPPSTTISFSFSLLYHSYIWLPSPEHCLLRVNNHQIKNGEDNSIIYIWLSANSVWSILTFL